MYDALKARIKYNNKITSIPTTDTEIYLAILDFIKIQNLPYQPLHTVTILFNNLQSISHLPRKALVSEYIFQRSGNQC